MSEFCLGQSVRKLPEKQGKVLFYKTYFEETNINRKAHIWSKDKIIMKFRQKKWASLVFSEVYENYPKIKDYVILRNLLRRESNQPETTYLVQ